VQDQTTQYDVVEQPQPLSRSDRQLPVRRYRMTIAYDGALFHGWQKQHPPGREPLRTVQGTVEAALVDLLQQRIHLVGASRTDAGVHAQGQVAQFDAATRIPPDRITMAVNARLPDDVEVLSTQEAAPNFRAINDVESKQYRYRIWNTVRRPLWIRHCVWHCWTRLDIDRMNEAAARLIGTHDFAAFTTVHHNRTSTVRTIHQCYVTAHAPEVHIVVQGDGFLYNMVRIIAGTLVEVGRGRFEPSQIDHAIATGDRRDTGPTLPPQGLILEWIRYPGDPDPVALLQPVATLDRC